MDQMNTTPIEQPMSAMPSAAPMPAPKRSFGALIAVLAVLAVIAIALFFALRASMPGTMQEATTDTPASAAATAETDAVASELDAMAVDVEADLNAIDAELSQ